VTRLSIEASFAWAQRFVAREWGLVLPIALAFIAFPQLALALVTPADLQQALTTVPIKDMARVQSAMAWLAPAVVAIVAIGGVGGLAITALALTPRMSVGEAIVLAVRRLPVLVGSVLLLCIGLLFFAVVEVTVLVVIGLDPLRVQLIAAILMIAASFALLVRMSPLPGVIVDRRIGPIDAIGETWSLGRGAGWKMLLAILIYYLGAIVIVIALGSALGACIQAVTRLGGWTAVADPLLAVVERTFGGITAAGAYVIGAGFYRQLSGKKPG